jgi:hypothetical protein
MFDNLEVAGGIREALKRITMVTLDAAVALLMQKMLIYGSFMGFHLVCQLFE